MDRNEFADELGRLRSGGETLSNSDIVAINHAYAMAEGHLASKITAIEEMAELQQVITKSLRGKPSYMGLLEEIADVYITLSNLQEIFCIDKKDVMYAIDIKTRRNRARLEQND